MAWTPPELRILYLEDEAIIAMETSQLLRDLGFQQISAAASLAGAEQALAEGMPDLALLDVSVGRGHSSLDLARKLLEAGVPVVLATGHTALDLQADPRARVLEKPFSPDDLEAALRHAVGSRHQGGVQGTAAGL
ncbi:response regulator [Frigidibacter mobilis]|uniref:Response regulator receiver and SARP domain-containing protein n=1 Tax=Frigidibacter mobilis TaxID=1335048 RepID=A0A159Z656_9RHOB|nr:response regulator [Frigidibacter mobilis]AMY69904.1 response regulator receiver and SARP domain-containing protein [Frigidibacter mobilis]